MADAGFQRRPHPLLVALAAIGALALVAVVFVLVGLGFAAKNLGKIGIGGNTQAGTGHEGYLNGISAHEMVAGIRLENEIVSQTSEQIVEKLMEAKEDSRVKGVFLEVNSPGGSVVASQEIYDAIIEVKATKPVVAYVREMAASGAYYSSASATRIVANRGSLVGSIGVIMSTVEVSQLMNWVKLQPVTIKTGKLKDAGSPTRAFTEDDKVYLQELINKTRDQFASDVKMARNLDNSALARMSDGRVVLGPEALELKLIDKVGGKAAALEELYTVGNLKTKPELIYMEETKEFPELLSQFLHSSSKSMVHEFAQGLVSEISASTASSAQPKLK